jgi:hypothetical protein
VQLVGEDEARTYTAERLAEHIADFCLAALEAAAPAKKAKKRSAKSV